MGTEQEGHGLSIPTTLTFEPGNLIIYVDKTEGNSDSDLHG